MTQGMFSKTGQLTGVVVLCGFPLLGVAQQSNDVVISMPEITVTADKKLRSISDVPAHVSALDAERVQQEGVSSLAQLEGRFAGLSFQPFGMSGINSPVMRGLTANFNALSSSTLLLVDGVPTLTAQGFDANLLGVDRIELLRGPRTTVYGQNAQTGVITVESHDLEGEDRTRLGVEVGSRNKRVLQLATARSLMEDTLRLSLTAEKKRQDGFIDNTSASGHEDDRDRQSMSFGLRWLPSDETDLTLRYQDTSYDDGGALWGAVSSERATVASGTSSWNHSRGQTYSASVVHQLSPNTELHSVTAYNRFQDKVQQDTDFQLLDLTHIGRDHTLRTLSQDLRLQGDFGATEWLLGAYLEKQDHDLRTYAKTYFGSSDLQADLKGENYALYTHWTSALGDQSRLIYGVRWSHNTLNLTPQGSHQRSQTWTHTSPQLTFEHDLNPHHVIYASYANGVRSGGFNTLSPVVDFSAFDPEESRSVELGLKGEFEGAGLRYSLSAYHMSIDDMQVMQMPTIGVIYLTNAAKGTSKGVEASLQYYIDAQWSTELGLAWNETTFDEFQDGNNDYSGKRNPFAPKLNGHAAVRYEALSGWSASASVVANSSIYLDAANTYEQAGYAMVNLAAQYPIREGLTLSAYANNVTDKEYDAVGYQNGYVTVYSPPREFGLKLVWDL